MAQSDISKFLRGRPNREFTSKEIAKGIGLPLQTVNQNLNALRKDQSILYRVQPKGKGGYLYKYDRFNEVLIKLYDNNNILSSQTQVELPAYFKGIKLVDENYITRVAYIIKNLLLRSIIEIYRIEYQNKRLAADHYRLSRTKLNLKINSKFMKRLTKILTALKDGKIDITKAESEILNLF
jgi:hypothetical protein